MASRRQKAILAACACLMLGMAAASAYYKNQRLEEKRAAAAKQAEDQARQAARARAIEAEQIALDADRRAQAGRRVLDEKREQLQGLLEKALEDPYSLRLKNLRVVQGKEGYVLCGDINAKLSSGQYFGERRFAVTETKLEGADGNVIGVPRTGRTQNAEADKALIAAAGCL